VPVPAVFHNQMNCAASPSEEVHYYAAADTSQFTTTRGLKSGPMVPCGATANATLDVSEPPVNGCPYVGGKPVQLDVLFGRTGQMMLSIAHCQPNPLVVPLDRNANPTCTPNFTVTGDINAGTVACTAQCS
jgi:hypothetical protein